MDRYSVIVIGLGAMGSAACYHLAQRGVRILGLERYDIPHALGSSHGFSRMTRLAYYEHPDYVPLLKSAFCLWHDLEAQGGQKLIYVTGGLYLGPPDGKLVGGSLKSARQHGLSHELIEHRDLRRRYGQFHVPENFIGMLEGEAGWIEPQRAIATHAALALHRGAELHGREEVLRIVDEQAGVEVITSRGTYRAEQVVLAGGAWTDRLARDLGIPLRVTRQVMAWVWPRQPELFTMPRCPVWAIDHCDGTIHYGFPMMLESPGLKLAHHGPAGDADPDRVSREITPDDEATVRPLLEQMIPQANGPLLSARVCLYTNSPDHHFILGRHPQRPRLLLACGFSGHGFKFAPVIGEILADLALSDATTHPIAFLSPRRFSSH